MFLISRGLTKLTVSLNDGIKIRVRDEVPAAAFKTAKAIAFSLKNLLHIKLKYSDNPNKNEVAHLYLLKMGWRVLHTD